MQWLNAVVDEIIDKHPKGEIVVSSGVSPSGTYHIGHLREVLTADAVAVELKKRGRKVRHIHMVDDLDALRKIPPNIPEEFSKYLGKPLADIPAPDGSDRSYADFFFDPFSRSVKALGIEMEVIRSHQKYRSGFFVQAIEKVLENTQASKETLQEISGRKLDPSWSPVQIMEGEYLKNRRFISLDKTNKTVKYEDKDGQPKEARYDKGEVKLDWRLDWPARWWLLGVNAEPFGRDHATKGGSYDTGVGLIKNVFGGVPPLPIPYDFINRAGDTQKMSASKGTGIDIAEALNVLPAEVLRYFVLRYAPGKMLYFDSGKGAMQLMDDFAALSAKADKSDEEQQILYVSNLGSKDRTVSRVPFSHLVASYQSALKNVDKTLEIIARTEHKQTVEEDADIIKKEIKFIDAWLEHWAPEDAKFELIGKVDGDKFSQTQKDFMQSLADKIQSAPPDADGNWYHQAIYDLKEESNMPPKEMFSTLYMALIGKQSGPRAGWFLSILPQDWLVARLRLGK